MPDGRLRDVLDQFLRRQPTLTGGKLTNLAYRPGERLLYVTEAEFGLLYQLEI